MGAFFWWEGEGEREREREREWGERELQSAPEICESVKYVTFSCITEIVRYPHATCEVIISLLSSLSSYLIKLYL